MISPHKSKSSQDVHKTCYFLYINLTAVSYVSAAQPHIATFTVDLYHYTTISQHISPISKLIMVIALAPSLEDT